MKLASTEGSEAAVQKTQSYEYWDEKPPEHKLSSLADYLEDVRLLQALETQTRMLT
jgi:dimeric dUTPase (all-alpha-NTP-PPase superfamily)